MKFDVLTLFPAMFAGPLDESIVKRAREAKLLDLKRSTTCATGRTTGTRRWTTNRSAAGRECC